MPENTRLNGCLDKIALGFMKREGSDRSASHGISFSEHYLHDGPNNSRIAC